MHDETLIPQADSGRDSLYFRSARVPARTVSATRGEAISLGSIAGNDGLPISVLRGREIQREQKKFFYGRTKKRRKRMKLIRHHPFSIAWVTILLTVGAVLQVVMK